jgi:hypothetical protein
MVRVREQEGDLFLDMGTILHYIESERARGRQFPPNAEYHRSGLRLARGPYGYRRDQTVQASHRNYLGSKRDQERFHFGFLIIAGPT